MRRCELAISKIMPKTHLELEKNPSSSWISFAITSLDFLEFSSIDLTLSFDFQEIGKA